MPDDTQEPEFGWATEWHEAADVIVHDDMAHFVLRRVEYWEGGLKFMPRPTLCGELVGDAYVTEGFDFNGTEPKCPACLAAVERMKEALEVSAS